MRATLLDTTREDLIELAGLVERATSEGSVCVVAPREILEKIDCIEKILEI
jgi:hypothetical protein